MVKVAASIPMIGNCGTCDFTRLPSDLSTSSLIHFGSSKFSLSSNQVPSLFDKLTCLQGSSKDAKSDALGMAGVSISSQAKSPTWRTCAIPEYAVPSAGQRYAHVPVLGSISFKSASSDQEVSFTCRGTSRSLVSRHHSQRWATVRI